MLFRSGMDVLWRYSTLDAFYTPPGIPVVLGSANSKRFLGAQSNLHLEWYPTPISTSLLCGYIGRRPAFSQRPVEKTLTILACGAFTGFELTRPWIQVTGTEQFASPTR